MELSTKPLRIIAPWSLRASRDSAVISGGERNIKERNMKAVIQRSKSWKNAKCIVLWPWVANEWTKTEFLILRGMRIYGWHKSKITFIVWRCREPKRYINGRLLLGWQVDITQIELYTFLFMFTWTWVHEYTERVSLCVNICAFSQQFLLFSEIPQ